MAKVITVSRKFPSHHPRKGEPTYFVEKILHDRPCIQMVNLKELVKEYDVVLEKYEEDFAPKGHTIRKVNPLSKRGKRWKTGDLASLRFWSAKPYYSPQVTFTTDIPIKVFDLYMCLSERYIEIDGKIHFADFDATIEKLATNDGLTVEDFKAWFGDDYIECQIIIWNEDITY